MSRRGAVCTLILFLRLAWAAAEQPHGAQEHAAKALRAAQAGDLQRAEAELREAARLAPRNPAYLSDLASVLRARKKPTEAVPFYRKALEADRGNSIIRRNLALALWDCNRLEEAVRELSAVLKQDPNDSIAASALAAAYYQRGQSEEAGRAARMLLAAHPVDPGAAFTCATAAAAAGDLATTVDLGLAMLRSGQQSSAVYNLLGNAYGKQGDLTRSTEAFENAIARDPSIEDNYLDLLRVLASHNQWRPALEVARKAVAGFPRASALYELKGLAETMLLLTADAIRSYTRALEIDPNSANANLGLAAAQRAAGMTQEAAATFERGIRKFPREPLHRQEYGLMLMADADAGDAAAEARAVALLEQAIALDAHLSETHYQLGKVALERGELRSALTHFEWAVKLDPNVSKIHYALSRAYRRAGRAREASQALESYQRLKVEEEKSNPGFPLSRAR